MENRLSSRKPLHETVTLDSPHIGSVPANTRDISLGGMFVETDPRVLLPSTALVVSFDVPHNGGRQPFRLTATVMRREAAGAGLMFLQMEPTVIRSLSEALSQHQPPT